MATRSREMQDKAAVAREQEREAEVTGRETPTTAPDRPKLPGDKPVAYPLDLPESEARQQTPAVGARATRPDGRLHGLGQTKYIEDLSLPHMIHGAVLRSEHAHARILSVDTSEAEAMPGVLATLTGKEFPVNNFGPTLQDQPVLADDVVRHMGDGVAAVAAITPQIAEEALRKIKVEYEPLPAVFDAVEAMEDDAVKVHPPHSNIYATKVIKKGDVEKALAEADHVFHRQFKTQMVEHVPIEPHASIATWDPNGRVTIYSSLGRITLGREDLSRTLGMPMSKIRLIGTVVGGNFGGKNEITQEPVLALLSKKTGRPVKGVFSRRDEFVSSTTRHPFTMDYTTGVMNDGRIIARKVRLVLDGGSYCSWTATTLGKGSILACGPYRIDNLLVEAYAVYTNKTTTGAMRGFGAPQVCFAYESQMDDIAEALGIDPLELRLRNVFEEKSASPTGQELQAVVVKESLLQCAERFGWKGWQR
jgi:CO/xanthine dehydrogenase Mo-binding subunit